MRKLLTLWFAVLAIAGTDSAAHARAREPAPSGSPRLAFHVTARYPATLLYALDRASASADPTFEPDRSFYKTAGSTRWAARCTCVGERTRT
jgi:hypothetical protein